jgi:tripartite-type tricarboxylate transporter receptor subunit TctC
VPYRGGAPALIDLLSGQVQVLFDPIPASIGYIKAGKLRALAVTTATRSAALADVPPVADFLPGYEASNWWGLCTPKNTPAKIIEQLNRETNAGLIDPKVKTHLADLGASPAGGTSADFGKHIADETDKWAKVIGAAKLKTG